MKKDKSIVWNPNVEGYTYDKMIPMGVELLCKWGERDMLYPIRVLETKEQDGEVQPARASSPPHDWVYYVHYTQFNRRMDEWVSRDRMIFREELAPNYDDSRNPGSAYLKYLVVNTESFADLDDHPDHHEEAIKLHAEVTKV